MFKKVFIVMVILIAVAAVLPAQAQVEPTFAQCNVYTLRASYIETLEGMTELSEIYSLQRVMAFDIARCLKLLFEDTEQAAIGPVTFPAAVYRAIFTTEGYGTVIVTVISGECEGTRSGSLFNLSRGEADEGAEAFFTVEEDGCTVLIEVDNVQDDWQLVFEPM